MPDDDVYPDEPAGPFPTPPRTITDREGRPVELRATEKADADREALVEMYTAFDPSDRAQGIPPTGEERIRDWLADVVGSDCLNVLAVHDDRAVGHAMLVPGGGAHELAIFVQQAYQNAGIGTELIETLLGYGGVAGIERVWLTVERWNEPAVRVYEKVGFEAADAGGFELEMAIRLDPGD